MPLFLERKTKVLLPISGFDAEEYSYILIVTQGHESWPLQSEVKMMELRMEEVRTMCEESDM